MAAPEQATSFKERRFWQTQVKFGMGGSKRWETHYIIRKETGLGINKFELISIIKFPDRQQLMLSIGVNKIESS